MFPAIDVLGRSGDPRAVEPLAALLQHPHYALEAVRALGRSGHPSAIRPLAQLLHSDNVLFVRLAAVALDELERRCFEQYGPSDRCNTDLEEAVRGKTDLDALVAYLQGLGTASKNW